MRSIRTVGIGELSLTVSANRGIDRTGAARALASALEAGFDFVDIAAEPDTEQLAGETLRELRRRDTVVAATRVPAIVHRFGTATRDTLTDRLPIGYVVETVETALRSTRLDALPLVQLDLRAFWRTSSAWPELAGACARLVKEGKVLEWGAFVTQIEDDTPSLVDESWFSTISVPFSICERTADTVLAAAATAHVPPPDDPGGAAIAIDPLLVIQAGLPAELVLQAAAARDAAAAGAPAPTSKPARRTAPITVLARRPLAGSALAGTIGPGVRLRHRDDRADLPAETLERVAVAATKLARFVKQVPPVARSCDAAKMQLETNKRPEHVDIITLAELALRYVITRGAIPLPRLHRHEHVPEALTASVLGKLDENLVEKLDI